MRYREHLGSVHFSEADNLFHGKVLGISNLMIYSAYTLTKLEEAFMEVVDDYVVDKEDLNR